ncbi:MAG: HipA domain-containing protein [Bacilli bacterium]|jgi:serine/threonine-protein kinase HipA|nr:HipA domain-containing protein [Bacilli bacterium]
MNKILKVYLEKEYIGELIEKDGQRLRFVYDLDAKSDISLRMPRSTQTHYHKATYAFFENLLPEGNILELIARGKGVSQNNPFSLLSVIGEDCAGAIHLHQYVPLIPEKLPEYISKTELNQIISGKNNARFIYQKGNRTSLAGARDKTTVIIKDDKFYAPNFFYPSTHIIKFDNHHFANILHNELFCTLLANSLGLSTSKMELITENDVPYLLIERFDRAKNPNEIRRLHQEDFCQLLSVSSKNKYQKEGGPCFRSVIKTINEFSYRVASDTLMIAKILVFNVLIGNCDYHGKNLSLLHTTRSLTPFYDLVSTVIYEHISTNMAMSINKKYEVNDINKQDITNEFNKWGINGERMFALIINDFKHIVKYAQALSKETIFTSKQATIFKIIEFIERQFIRLQ